MRSVSLLILAGVLASSSAFAADYRDGAYRSRAYRSAYVQQPRGFRAVPPTYYVDAPPRFIQDVRTGEPGYWVDNRRTVLDEIFGNYY